MIDTDKWQEIFNSIGRHKLRTALTAFGVAWGIFMLVVFLGAGKGLENGVKYSFQDDALNSIWLYKGSTSKPYKGLKPGRNIQFYNSDYDLVKSEIPQVEHISGRYWLRGETIVRRGNKLKNFGVRCVHPGHLHIENTIMTEGRFINEQDIEEKRKVVVIGKLVKEGFYEKEENPIGTFLSINNVDYKVIGSFYDQGGEWEMRRLYVPITTVQSIYGNQQKIDQLMFTLGDASPEETEIIEQEVKRKFAAKHNFDVEDSQAIYVRNNVTEFLEFQNFFAAIKIFIWVVGIGSILAGIIGVSNIMLIIVKDRTKEIGIRKALGATPASIIGMIVQEAVFITSVAGYMGLLTGVGLLYLVEQALIKFEAESEFFRNPEVDFNILISAVIVLVISGALAGLIPAMKAVNIHPVEAMRV